jgi:hypothetical protein
MKPYLFIATLLFSYTTLHANEVSWVDEQVDAIKPPRVGLKTTTASLVKDPFIFLNKSQKTTASSKSASTPTMADSIIPLGIVNSQTDTSLTQQETYKKLSVDAILNKSALIQGQWYKQDDTVQGYTIKSVHKTTIVLSKNNKDLILSTNSKNLNLKFKEK